LVLDTGGRIVRYNPYMEEISGYRLEEMRGKDWFDNFLPESIRSSLRQSFANAIREIQTRGSVDPILTRDGKELLIEWYDKTLKDANGNISGLLAIGQDITAKKRAEEALRQSEEQYRQIVELANEGIWMIDRDSTTTFANQRMAKMLGYSVDEMLGRSLFDFMDEKGKRLAEDYVKRRKQGIVEQHEFKFIRKDGQDLWALLGTCPLMDDGRSYNGALAMVTDITEIKRIDNSLRATLAEKEILLREVHHRVKNNIQAIIYLIESRMEQITDNQIRLMLKGIQEQARTMGLVYEQLYQTDSLTKVGMQRYLHDLSANVVEAFGCGRQIELNVDCEDIHLEVASAIPCGLMVNELLTNALKYAFPSSYRGIPQLTISFETEDNHYELTVQDNGVGLPADIEHRTQQRMGLRLVKLWATHQMGGTLEVLDGDGTSYHITFPYKNE
jgi:PAS domain S-box-containing protein